LWERVGRELDITVYLYEAAATCPDRQDLENIRRGQYEELKGDIGIRNPDNTEAISYSTHVETGG
jgi:glutamate formiminotransferase / formiminotetrahydrofolate cyclodeaminase